MKEEKLVKANSSLGNNVIKEKLAKLGLNSKGVASLDNKLKNDFLPNLLNPNSNNDINKFKTINSNNNINNSSNNIQKKEEENNNNNNNNYYKNPREDNNNLNNSPPKRENSPDSNSSSIGKKGNLLLYHLYIYFKSQLYYIYNKKKL